MLTSFKRSRQPARGRLWVWPRDPLDLLVTFSLELGVLNLETPICAGSYEGSIAKVNVTNLGHTIALPGDVTGMIPAAEVMAIFKILT